jgi:uncharacterized protein with FMN-binding domain
MLKIYEQNARKKLAATIVGVTIIAGVVVTLDQLKTKAAATANTEIPIATDTGDNATPSPTATATPTPTPTGAPAVTATKTPAPTRPPVSTPASGYKNGTFTAASTYYVPHGSETIQVSLTLSQGVVSNVSIQNSQGDNVSARYQQDFAAVYRSYVIGKPVSSLRLNAVAGASDTSDGFNAAVSQIASQARA